MPVFGLWNGTDGLIPPPYLGRTFDDTVNHYIASGASAIDSADIEDSISLISKKGYGTSPGTKILILANPDDGENIMAFRAGQPSRSSGPDAKYDFIPALDQPAFITPAGELVGQQVPGTIFGVKVEGSYGPALLVHSDFVPSGYVAVVATGGPNSDLNVMGFRQHPNPAYQDLRMIPGPGAYPLTESFHQRSFGVGVRQRGAAVAIKITAGSYAAPSACQIPV